MASAGLSSQVAFPQPPNTPDNGLLHLKAVRSFVLASLLLVAAGAFAASDIAVVRERDGVAVPNGSSFSFGAGAAGAPDSRRFRIYNTGSTNLVIANPTALVSGEGFSMIAYPVATVHPGDSTTFRVQFMATAPGDYSGAITISSNDPDENPYLIHLFGSVTPPPPPDIAVFRNWDGVAIPNNGSFTFPSTPVDVPDSRLFRIDNTGSTTLTVAEPVVTGTGWSLIESPYALVAPGTSTTFRVRLHYHIPGTYSGMVSISTNDPDESPYRIDLTGTVLPPPAPDIAVYRNWDNVLVPNGGAFTFPGTPVNDPDSRLFRIDNRGNETLTITNPTALVSGAAWSLIEVPASSVPPGGSTTFRVRLLYHIAGTYSGSISIQTNDPDQNPYTIALSGAVTTVPVEISVSRAWDGVGIANGGAFAFDPVPPGVADSRQFRISNSGTDALNVAVTVTGACFSLIESAAGTVPPGSSTTFRVRILCTTLGTPSGTVSIASNDPDENPFTFNVTGTIIANGATFVAQSFPSSMNEGQTYNVSVTMRNSGTSTWTAGANYRLGIRPDIASALWGTSRIVLPAGVSIPPGGSHVFAFPLTAPTTPGNDSLQWQMVQESGEWFGDVTPLVTINVAQSLNNAVVVSQSVPTTMAAGQTYPVSVTMRNTGNTTWRAADSYRLGSVTPGNPFGSRVNLGGGEAIAPQNEKTFTWNVTAPATAGNYTFQWRMVQEPTEWFGATTAAVTVNVRAAITPTVASLNPEVIISGRTETVTINGSNFAGASVVASAVGRTLPGVSVLSVTANQIRVQVNASNPAVDGFYGLEIHGAEGMTAVPIRIVQDKPIIDSWTPAQAAGGDTYLLMITGENLGGAIVRAAGGVVVYDVESPDDNNLTGLLEARGSSGTTDIEVVGRNGRSSRVTIELRARNEIDKKMQMLEGKGATGETVPGIYLQEPAFAPRSSLDKTIVFGCHFSWTRGRFWSRRFALFRNAQTHQYDANLLLNLVLGEHRNIEAFIVISAGSRSVTVDLYCTDYGLEFDICFEMDLYVEIVGIGSQYLYASACLGSDGPHATFGGNGFFNFEFTVRGNGGRCTRVTPTNGTQNIEGLPTADVEQLECCREDIAISGEYFLIDDPPGYSRQLPSVVPRNGSAVPGNECWGNSINVIARAFIPVNYVKDPAHLQCLVPPLYSMPRDILWKGDDRWFQLWPRSWRMQQIIDQNGSVNVDPGETHVYADDALAFDGRITPGDDDGVLNDCHLLHLVGLDTGMAARSPAWHELVSPGVHRFHLIGSGDNPVVPSPDISWDYWIEVNTNVSPRQYRLWGTHDCYPAYEIFINSDRIYGFVHPEIQPGDVTNRPGILNECLWPFNPHVVIQDCQGSLGVSPPCGRQGSSLNEVPVAHDDSFSGYKNQALTLTQAQIVANDTEIEGHTIGVYSVGPATNGTTQMLADGSIEYLPSREFVGTDSFEYTAEDSSGGAYGTARIDVTVLQDSRPEPNFTVTCNDLVCSFDASSSTDDRGIVVYEWTLGNGSAAAGKTFTYAYAAIGAYLVRLTVQDVIEQTAAITKTVTVICAKPSISAQPTSRTINLGQSTTLLVTASGATAYQWYQGTAPSTATPVGTNGSSLPVTPSATSSYWVNVTNGCESTASGTATVTVCSPPSIAAQPASQVITTGASATLGVTAGGSGPFSYQWYEGSGGSTTTPVGTNVNTYSTPNLSANKSYWVRVTSFCNGTASVDSNAATITVTPVRHAPTVANDSAETKTRTAVLIGVLANDFDLDGDRLTVTSVTQPARGTVAINASQSVTYTPASNFAGTEIFDYTVSDGTGLEATATVTVKVLNEAPLPRAEILAAPEDTWVGYQAFNVLANDIDPDGDELHIVKVEQPQFGTFQISSDSSQFSYKSKENWHGIDSFYYTVGDPFGAEVRVLSQISVSSVNDAPVAHDDSFSMYKNQVLTITQAEVVANDTDIEGDTISVYSVGPATNATTQILVDGTIEYRPFGEFVGTDSFGYTAADGGGAYGTARINVTVLQDTTPVPNFTVSCNGFVCAFDASSSTDDRGIVSYQWILKTGPTTSSAAAGKTFTFTYPAEGLFDARLTVEDVLGQTAALTKWVTVCAPLGIATQPASQTITSGYTAMLSVTASGTGPLSYQWYEGPSGTTTTPVGTNSNSYTTTGLTASKSYWVRVTSTCSGTASVNSSAATISVCAPPSIATQPASKTINSGGTATLSVVAGGSGPFSYQWYDETNIFVGTGSTYTTPALTASRSYWVRVTSTCNGTLSVASNLATVTVCDPPGIVTHPAPKLINAGATTTLSVTASGSGPINYQWYEGASGTTTTPVGTNSDTFTTPALSATKSYWVRVTSTCNGSASVNSNAAAVTVCAPPGFATQPASKTIATGSATTLTVTASGSGPFSYQWYEGTSGTTTTPVGTNDSSYTTPALTANKSYWVRVTSTCNGSASVNSNTATITMTCATPPSISASPTSRTIVVGQPTTLSVTASGFGPLTYQWYQGMAPSTTTPVGTNSGSLTVTPGATTDYWVNVSNACGGTASATATVTVCTPPTIATHPASTTISYGATATLSVVASGTGPFSYQWYEGAGGVTTAPVGTNSASFTTPSLAATRSYWVRVSNACSVNSNAATVTVNTPVLARRQLAASTANSQLTITTNWTQPTQAGNLLVAIVSAERSSYQIANWQPPAGWQLAVSYEMVNVKTSIYYYPNNPGGRNAETFGNGGYYDDMILQLAEYTGVATVSPLDKTAFNGNQSNDGYVDTGYTPQTSQAKELVITALTSYSMTEFFGPSQGFIELDDRNQGWGNLTTAVHERITTTAGSWGHYAQVLDPSLWVGMVATFRSAQ